MLWLVSGSLQRMQYLLDMEHDQPPRFELVNLDAIHEHRRRVDNEYLGDNEAERAMLEFSGMPVPVFRITDSAFALDYFSAGIPCASLRLREALDLTDSVIRYRDIDLDGSPPALRAHHYQMFHTVTYADPIDWDRTPAQSLAFTRPDGSIRRMRLLPPPNPAEPSARIYWRTDFVPPAPLFHVAGTAWTMATDALAERVMRARITDVMFQDIASERGQTEFVIRQL